MEPSPDLTAAREAWRHSLLSREAFSSAQMRELEVHLDDGIDDLLTHGLSAEEAFMIAARRLGAAEPLADEYRKAGGVPGWDGRARWMLLGMVVYLGSVALAQILGDGVYLATRWLPPGWWRDGWMVPASYLGATGAGIWFLRSCLRGRFSWLPVWAKRHPARAIGVMFAATFLLPRILSDGAKMLAVRRLGVEEFGTHMRLLSFVHLASTAVFLGALLVLLRPYWRPARPSQLTE